MCVASSVKTGLVVSCLMVLVGCGGSSGGGDQPNVNPGTSSSSVNSSLRTSSSIISSSISSSRFSNSSSLISSSISTNSSTSSLTLVEQEFNFEVTGTVIKRELSNYSNAAVGQGNGIIQYRSSNTDIARVDNKGVVSINSVGLVTITATIAADNTYMGATTSYSLKVIPRKVSIKAWVGKNDSLIEFPAGIKDYEFYRTSQISCDISTFSSCANGNFSVLNDAPIIDTTLNLDRDAVYTLKQAGYQDELIVSASGSNENVRIIEVDHKHDVLVHDNKMWRLAHTTQSENYLWSSENAIDWDNISLSESSQSIHRDFFNAVSFNDKLWLISGSYSSSESEAVVYWAVDTGAGLDWIAVITNNIFSQRNNHQSIVFNGKLWVIGGKEGRTSTRLKNDVWSSVNGLDWVEESANAAFSARDGHQVVVFNNKLWLIGGNSLNENMTRTLKNDVWSSIDGVTWVQETAAAEFSPRDRHQVVAFKGKLWLVGGRATPSVRDIWSSTDGVNWVNETSAAIFSKREYHQMVVFEEKLFLIDGDVWMTEDGINWRLAYKNEFSFLEHIAR